MRFFMLFILSISSSLLSEQEISNNVEIVINKKLIRVFMVVLI